MTEVKQIIETIIARRGIRYADGFPVSNTHYPFISYELSETQRSRTPLILRLAINVWTIGKTFEEADQITEALDLELENLKTSNSTMLLTFKRTSRMPVGDTNAAVKRNQITYQIRIWEGK